MTLRRGRTGLTSRADLEALQRLRKAGGWTPDEAAASLSNVEALIAEGLISTVHTAMGPLVLLRHQGALEAFGRRAPTLNPAKAVDRAYFRLCLRDLGWIVVRPAHEGRPRDCDRINRLPLVRTRDGLAYVIAQLNGHGCSTSHMRQTLDWIRSRLLYEGRVLLVLTPSSVRGQKFARDNPNTVRIVTHRPVTTQAKRPKNGRLRGGTPQGAAWGHPEPSDGAIVTPHNLQEYRERGVPDLTLEVLSLSRRERVERARASLEKDLVLSGQQLARHYGLSAADMSQVPFAEDLVVPVHGQARGERQVRFYLATGTMARRRTNNLAHLAGTAELRHQLGIPTWQWMVIDHTRPDYEDPDARWRDHSDAGVAIEYDSGAYPLVKVLRKLNAFHDRGYQSIVWGVPSATRARHLKDTLDLDVRVVRWYE